MYLSTMQLLPKYYVHKLEYSLNYIPVFCGNIKIKRLGQLTANRLTVMVVGYIVTGNIAAY